MISEPTRRERYVLICRLEQEFGFTPSQAQYLAVNSFGYCSDLLDQIDDIHKCAKMIKRCLENYGLN